MIQLADFLSANPSAKVHGPAFAQDFHSFQFDSRIVQPGQLFMAVKTSRADGHDYIEAACRDGASGAISQHPVDLSSLGATCIVVEDTETAVRNYARFISARMRERGRPIVAITGSAGKTTTKEIVAHLLGQRFRVFKNPGNYNGAYGLPIALGYLEEDHEILVLEVGTDHFGETALQAEIAPPDVALVTLVAAAHAEAFGSEDAIAQEKGDLIAALQSSGLAILNGDDRRVRAMAKRSEARVVFCSTRLDADPDVDPDPNQPPRTGQHLVAERTRVTRQGTRFELELDGRRLDLSLPWLGEQFARSALMAIAVGRHFGLSDQEIEAGLASLPPVPGRLNPIEGRHRSLLLDDSYNASPKAVIAGLDVLADLPAGLRIAALGDMAELGDLSHEGHLRVGRHVADTCDLLVTKGELADGIAEGARKAGMPAENIIMTYRGEDAIEAIASRLRDAAESAEAVSDAKPGPLVLVKGSAVARMERVVAGLMQYPEQAPQCLVRQDKAWREIVVLRADRPTWVEIDLGAVANNVQALAEVASPAKLIAVLKADAYGHGAPQVTHTALRNGAWGAALACLSEAVALREASIRAPLLVLGFTPGWQAREAIRHDIRVTLYDLDTAKAFNRAALELDSSVRVHVKVDTGMHRLGLAPEEVPAFLAELGNLPGLEVEGLFTHMACADELDGPGLQSTARQLERFRALMAELDASSMRPPMVHAANSALALSDASAHFDAIRAGIAIYGLAPSPDFDASAHALRPALRWKTQVAQIRELPAGEAIGYGHTWKSESACRIATIPVGYADGFRRAPQTWKEVLVRGQRAPLVGRVSMDQSTINISNIEGVRQGDEVVLIGQQGEDCISAEEAAGWIGTINYELVSAILARVPRLS